MSKHKKNVTKLKYVKMGSTSSDRSQLEEESQIIDQIEESPATIDQDIEETAISLPSQYKRFSEQEQPPERKALPGFLQKAANFAQSPLSEEGTEKASQFNPFPQNSKSNTRTNSSSANSTPGSNNRFGLNPNSFSLIFNKDHQEINGVQRVFKKSLTFLGTNLFLFLLLSLAGLNFFSVNIIITVILAVCYVSLTNIFFIIVADRSYIWLSLLGQAILVIFTHSFFGLGFDKITLVFTLILVLLTYLAYTELEKIQLSSRLFSISHITNEATRILSTVVLILISLGVYNSIVHEGSQQFLNRVVLSNRLLLDNVFIGTSPSFSANRFIMAGRFYPEAGRIVSPNFKGKRLTFRDYLSKTADTLTDKEKEDIRTNCQATRNAKDCEKLIASEENKLLEKWQRKVYPDLNYTLTTPLDIPKFREITKRYYLNEVREFEIEKDDDGLIPDGVSNIIQTFSIPRKNIIPALIAVCVYLFLFLIKFILNWFIFIFTVALWKILVWTGFVQIDIETVEAEIVSI